MLLDPVRTREVMIEGAWRNEVRPWPVKLDKCDLG